MALLAQLGAWRMTGQAVCVIGGCHIDRHLYFDSAPVTGRTNPARIVEAPGGVAANIARHLAAAGHKVGFAGVHPDGESASLCGQLRNAGIGAQLIPLEGEAPSYTALIGPDGELLIGAAALSLYDAVTADVLPAMLASLTAGTALPATMIIDANYPESVLQALVDALTADQSLYAAATSPRKVDRLAAILPRLDGLVLNRAEATQLATGLTAAKPGPDVSMLASTLAGRMRHGGHVLVSDGGDSAALATGDQLATAMPPAIQMVNANGAGDAMAAALFSAMLASRHVRPDEKDTGKLLETALAAGARYSLKPAGQSS